MLVFFYDNFFNIKYKLIFFFLAKLNLTKLNKVSQRLYPENVKLSTLPVDQVFPIKNIRQIKSKKSGKWHLLDFGDDQCVFVNEDTNKYLLQESDEIKVMKDLIKNEKIGFKHVGSSILKFVTLMNGRQVAEEDDDKENIDPMETDEEDVAQKVLEDDHFEESQIF